jgi:hypothetical protein
LVEQPSFRKTKPDYGVEIMGLFSNKDSKSSTLTLDQVPSAETFDVNKILNQPLAEYVRQLEGPYQPYAAYLLSVEGKLKESEAALREIIANADAANVWLAEMELGTLLFEFPDRIPEANYSLVQCVGSPFLDVARNAAWNMSLILRKNGHEGKAEGYADLAVALHNPLAMVSVAERFERDGNAQQAIDAFEFAASHTSRIDPFRPRVEVGLARKRTAGVEPKAAQFYLDGLGLLEKEHFSASNVYVNTREFYNSEAGSAAISTKYFGDCDASCYFEPIQIDCKVCGRNPSNYIAVPSGDGDGVYPVFTFLSDGSGELGAISIFRGLLDDLIDDDDLRTNSSVASAAVGYSENWATFLGSASPMVLGELDVDELLIFSDGSKSLNDRDLAVVTDGVPGKYSVICWLSAPNDGDNTIRPLALAAVRGDLRDDLLGDLDELSLQEVNELRQALWGGDFVVSAHAADIRKMLAVRNFEMAADSDLERFSWLLQQAEFGDDGLYDLIRSQNLPDESTLRALLARRGIVDAKLPWFTGAPAASVGLSNENSSPVGLTKSNSGGLGGPGLGGGGLTEPQANLAKFCGSCGNKFDGDQQKFCSSCGSPR